MHFDGTISLWGGLAALVSWCSLSPVLLAGESACETPNFRVVAPSAWQAAEVGRLAEECRGEIATEWLERELPTAPQPTSIHLRLVGGPSRGRILVDPAGADHRISIEAASLALAKPLLRHEVAHTVLLASLGEAIPDWANEGIASRYDNARRHAIRGEKLREFALLDSWPSLPALFESPIEAQWSYAASVSLTDFLVARRGKREFIDFLRTVDSQGYDLALRQHYGLRSTDQLEVAWRNHVRHAVAQKNQDEVRGELVLGR